MNVIITHKDWKKLNRITEMMNLVSLQLVYAYTGYFDDYMWKGIESLSGNS